MMINNEPLSIVVEKINKFFSFFCSYVKKLLIIFKSRKRIFEALSRRRALLMLPDSKGVNLVILLLPPNIFMISGGLFSILNIAATSREILEGSHKVVVTYLPGTSGLAMYPYFPNSEIIFTFTQIMQHFPDPKSLIVHIPECYAANVFCKNNSPETQYLATAKQLHINILNQNILLMPKPEELEHLSALTSNITQTTAHAAYCTQDNADKWDMPTLHLSAPFWKEYPFIPYMLKRDWIAYSPDANPMRDTILSHIRKKLPHFKFIKINGVCYLKYLEIISHSKYVISFGEGFDGFFFEPYHCGTIGCTARNNDFFTDNMDEWHMLYKSFSDMNDNIVNDILAYEEDPTKYIKYSSRIRSNLLSNIDGCWQYFRTKLRNYYNNKFDFTPH